VNYRQITPARLLWFIDLFSGTNHGATYANEGYGCVTCRGSSFDKNKIRYDFHCTLGSHQYTLTSEDLFDLIQHNCWNRVIPEAAFKIQGAFVRLLFNVNAVIISFTTTSGNVSLLRAAKKITSFTSRDH
jgi:hypothetical protein